MYSKPRPQKDSRRAESAGFFGPPPPPPSAQDASEPQSRAGWVSPARSNAAQPSHPAPPAFSRPSPRPRPIPASLHTVRDPPTQPAQPRARGAESEKRSAEGGPGIPPPSLHPSPVARTLEPPRLSVLSPPFPYPGLRQPRRKVADLYTGRVRIPPETPLVPPSPPAEVPAVTTGAA